MQVTDLRAFYTSRNGLPLRAVDGVSLSVGPGEVLGIAGESACGKSTLASVLALNAAPNLQIQSGKLKFDELTVDLQDIANAPRDWHGRIVSLLPQRAMNSLNPTARIRDFAFDVIRAHEPKTTRKEAVERARERLEQLSLPTRVIDSYPHQLSGGMRQRVVAVISTLLNPQVLIADEPSSALDVSSQKLLVGLLQELMNKGFITRIVFITHDLPLLSNIADRIAIMYAGQLVEVGATRQIVDHPEHPYTKALIGSSLDPNPDLGRTRIEGLPGSPPDLRDPPPACRFNPRCSYAMDVCRREDPPMVGTPDRFALCWWVKQHQERGVDGANREQLVPVSSAS